MFKTRDTASAAAVHGGAAGPQPSSTSVAHRHHTTGPHLDRGSPSEPRLSRSPCPSRWRLRSNNTTTTAGLTHGEAKRRLHPLHPSSLTPPALFTFATVEPAIRTPGNKAAVWCLRLAVDVHLLDRHPSCSSSTPCPPSSRRTSCLVGHQGGGTLLGRVLNKLAIHRCCQGPQLDRS